MKVYLDVDFYTTAQNHRKTVQKTDTHKKQKPSENQRNTEYLNIS